MKIKTLRNVALGIGCLMLTLTLSLNLILTPSTASKPIHVIQPMEDMPGLGMNKPSQSIIHIDEDSPVAIVSHVIRPMEDSPSL